MTTLLRLLSKLIVFISQTLGLGTGVAWSGEIAMFFDPNILQKLIPETAKVVLIAGTNGKTTTTKMVDQLAASKFTVVHNATGANLVNGLVGTILTQKNPKSKKPELFVFEIDESNLPKILAVLTPNVLVFLNLFRDQLDRYGEVDSISKKWLEALSEKDLLETTLIVNGDDPALAFLASKLTKTVGQIRYFGINDRSLFLDSPEHAVDSIFCPNCGARLVFSGLYLSHLGDYTCPKCKFTHPILSLEASKVETSLEGLYMVYNALAATLVGQNLEIDSDQIATVLKEFRPAFGRQEELTKDGKTIKILLSKNPAGFNASLRTVLDTTTKGPLLLVLNDRVPDGTDVSWIWDVDFEVLKGQTGEIFVSGDRSLDLGLRLKYAEMAFSEAHVLEALAKTQASETLWILATYTAMLEIRKTLTGKSIL